MSSLKYKSSNTNSSSSTNSSNQPIWCSLTTPSQIARKYASIAPIWCHISRPRQLKKKFASTLHQAQNLLTRQHSRDNNALTNGTGSGLLNGTNGGSVVGGSSITTSSGNGLGSHAYTHHVADLDDEIDINTYKNTAANANTSNWTPSSAAGIMASDSSSSGTTSRKDLKTSSDLTGRLLGNSTAHDTGDYDLATRLSLRKRDSSLDNRPFRKQPESRCGYISSSNRQFQHNFSQALLKQDLLIL